MRKPLLYGSCQYFRLGTTISCCGFVPATRSRTTSPFPLFIFACASPVVSSTCQEKAAVSVAAFSHLKGYSCPRISDRAAFWSGVSLGSNVITTQESFPVLQLLPRSVVGVEKVFVNANGTVAATSI